ncbi:TetR/AcrR family transcriptional regulator [Pyxidicoccus fallax]|uniref:TetR/AcrR family transcriptional regulator n=1 Tax=Pyxidicoccus fallax TaxID=394095 RepID=UPI0031B586DC
MPAALLSREEVVGRLLGVFRQQGYDGASLAALSEATGLGRSSLYHYFPGGKDDMVNAVLDAVEAWLKDVGLAPLRESGTPEERLRAMLRTLDGFYEGGRLACALGALSLGSAKERLQPRLREIMGLWMTEVARVLEEAGLKPAVARERAEDALVEVQGALVLSSGMGDAAPFKRAMKRLPETLLRDAAPPRRSPKAG